MTLLQVEDLRAYYQTEVYGISRSVRAVDGVSFNLERNEIYGVAGESSCGKTTLIKVIAGAIKPPLRIESGSVRYHFNDFEVDMRDDYPTGVANPGALERDFLCHARFDERPQPGTAHHPHL